METERVVTRKTQYGETPGETGTRNVVYESATTHAGPVTILQRFVYFLLGILEVILAFRFFLKLFGANPESSFVDFVYRLSGVFVAPFRGIFPNASADIAPVKALFEPATLVAMAVYGLIAWGIAYLISLLAGKPDTVVD